MTERSVLWVLLLWTFLLASSEGQAAKGDPRSDNNATHSRPILNVFYEPISEEQCFTDMTDDDDQRLLDFWQETWRAAGWEPRILSLDDAKRHPLYKSFKEVLDDLAVDEFGKLSLLRWLAMSASGGGWLADYDAFPLRDFPNDEMPHKGEMTIYEAVAPVLASGSADAWLETAKFLLKDAKHSCHPKGGKLCFWTDTLGVLNAWRDPNCTFHVEKQVLDGRKAMKENGLFPDECNKKPYRGKWVVHFGHFAMLEAPILPELRLPRHRLTIAKEWLPTWKASCLNLTNDT